MDDRVAGSPGATGGDTFWAGRRVLLTGHTGFKGSWLALWLTRLGAVTMGISLEGSPAPPRLWDDLGLDLEVDDRADLSRPGWEDRIRDFSPEVVLHLAAQALVPVGYADPVLTWTSNVLGTVRLMALLDSLPSLQATLVVTTDKVYDPRQPAPHAETAFLGGEDPYSASKAATELVVASWPSLVAPVAVARAGNVIGGGDRSPDRLLPDVVRSWASGTPVPLRQPGSVRPWQHVLEPLDGYLRYAEALATGRSVPRALNLGPTPGQLVDVASVVDLAHALRKDTGLPVPAVAWTSTPCAQMPENPLLEIDSELARTTLGWSNRLSWQESVAWTVDWHLRAESGQDPRALVEDQLDTYLSLSAAASSTGVQT